MKPRPRVEIAVAAGVLSALFLSACSGNSASPSVSASSRAASPQGSSRPATPSTTSAALTSAGALAQLHPLTGPFLAHGSDPTVLPAPVIVADEDNNRLVIIDPQGRTLWEFPRPGDLAPARPSYVLTRCA